MSVAAIRGGSPGRAIGANGGPNVADEPDQLRTAIGVDRPRSLLIGSGLSAAGVGPRGATLYRAHAAGRARGDWMFLTDDIKSFKDVADLRRRLGLVKNEPLLISKVHLAPGARIRYSITGEVKSVSGATLPGNRIQVEYLGSGALGGGAMGIGETVPVEWFVPR